jgi:nuclear pore complex protein Nup107
MTSTDEQTLVDHLQSRSLLNTAPPLEARHGYIPSTLRRTRTAKASKQPVPSSLDPDFTLRDPHHGTGLAGEDLTYETPLLETLWDLVRHGELDKAIEVCEQGGEPWRAATLMGGRRWNMPGLTTDTLEDMGGLEGNRKRALWKKSCRAMAKNPTLPAAERHLYAALISDLPHLHSALETWEDLLWANVQYKMEARLERRWKELGGFWQEEDRLLGEDAEFAGVSMGGMDDIFAAIGAVQKNGVQ